jgi:hypothetical protein
MCLCHGSIADAAEVTFIDYEASWVTWSEAHHSNDPDSQLGNGWHQIYVSGSGLLHHVASLSKSVICPVENFHSWGGIRRLETLLVDLVGGLEHSWIMTFPSYWEYHHNWRTHIFRGVGIPDTHLRFSTWSWWQSGAVGEHPQAVGAAAIATMAWSWK